MKKRYDYPIPFGWYCVDISRDLKPGDVKPLSYFGREQVLFRTESGEAKMLDAFCPHLGAHLGHGGKVDGEIIACPFHGWEFNGAGECTNVPYAKNIPPRASEGQVIPPYPVSEVNGFVWAWYHPDNVAPLFEVDEVPELNSPEWSDIECYEWTVHSIVQECGENAVDGAHFVWVHGAQSVPQGEYEMDGHRRVTKLKIQVPKLDENGVPDLESGEMEDTGLTSINVGPGFAWQRFEKGFDSILMLSATPLDDQSVHLRFAFTHPKEISDVSAFLCQAFREETCRQVEQDMPIWNNKKYAGNPILCDGDGPIAKYRKWFSQFYADAA